MLSPEERHVSVAIPIILVPGGAAGCCSEQDFETTTIELAKTPEDERIWIVTEDSLSDATLARSQSIEKSPAAQGRKAQSARPGPAEAPPLNSKRLTRT